MTSKTLFLILFLAFLTAALHTLWHSRQAAQRLLYPPRKVATTTPAQYGIPVWEDVTFSAGDVTLGGWFIAPKPEADGATLIFVHGFGANREALLEQAAALSPFGYGALLIDLRNAGSSQGSLTSWGYREAADVQAAFAYLQTRPEVNPSRIGLVGRSAGGAAVVRAAAQLPQVWLVVVESSYTSLADNMPAISRTVARVSPVYAPLVYGWMKQMSGLPLDEIRSIDQLPGLNVPVLFIHGDQDVVVNVSHSQRMFEAAQPPKDLFVVPTGGHVNIFAIDPAAFTERLVGFLTAH